MDPPAASVVLKLVHDWQKTSGRGCFWVVLEYERLSILYPSKVTVWTNAPLDICDQGLAWCLRLVIFLGVASKISNFP